MTLLSSDVRLSFSFRVNLCEKRMGTLALKPGLLLALLFTVACPCVYSVRCHDLPRSLSKVYSRSKCHSYRTAVNELSRPPDGQDRLNNAGKHYMLSMLC